MKKKPTALGIMLGRNIAERRNKLGMTQAEFAEKLEADVVTISRFERGSHLPSLLRLEKIASTLCMPLAELLSHSTSLSSDQSLIVEQWLNGLSEPDRQLTLSMLQIWCSRLSTENR